MREPIRTNQKLPAYFAAGAIPILFFILVLLVPIPAAISRIFWSYSFPLFLLTLLLYFVSFRLPGIYGWIAAACLTMLLLGLRLSFFWSSAYSNDKIIGGLVPFRDGFDYYNGAKLILSGHVITLVNEGAAWRPLYPGFLASLLFITGQNLQAALAVEVGLAGMCYAVSAYYLRNLWGAAAASLYATLLYFFIQHLVGTTYTEPLGLALGCLGLVLLLKAAKTARLRDLVFGLAILMLAVSARAGTFFIFPALVLWAGWAFRGERCFSFRYAGVALLTITLTYLVFNTLYGKFMVEPGGFPFANFAWTLYGQVEGGAGYVKAFQELGVRNPALIMRAAERFFFAHPLSFFIGAAKAYRDFFMPQFSGFAFGQAWADILLWAAGTALLLAGLYRSVRKLAEPEFSLLVAGFVGILASIPFLPPIDGGIRIYASTLPFFYAIPSAVLTDILAKTSPSSGSDAASSYELSLVGSLSILLTVCTLFVPVLILRFALPPVFAAPACTAEQVSYAAIIDAGSYIDILPDGTASCGTIPEVCLSVFQANRGSNDPSDAATLDVLVSGASGGAKRIFASTDMVSGRPHLFVGNASGLNVPNHSVITGCAGEARVVGRPSVYVIQTVSNVR